MKYDLYTEIISRLKSIKFTRQECQQLQKRMQLQPTSGTYTKRYPGGEFVFKKNGDTTMEIGEDSIAVYNDSLYGRLLTYKENSQNDKFNITIIKNDGVYIVSTSNDVEKNEETNCSNIKIKYYDKLAYETIEKIKTEDHQSKPHYIEETFELCGIIPDVETNIIIKSDKIIDTFGCLASSNGVKYIKNLIDEQTKIPKTIRKNNNQK